MGKRAPAACSTQLFPYGTHTLDRIAFQKALDDIGADESAGADFSLNVLTDHFERGMELLADNELHPALPENAFKVVQQQTEGALAGQLQSPDYLTSRALDSALYPKDDPELREATPATVKSLVLENVTDYYQHVFRPDLTTIVVIGNVTPRAGQGRSGEIFRRVESVRATSGNRSPAGACKFAAGYGGAGQEPRAGECNSGRNAGAEPI